MYALLQSNVAQICCVDKSNEGLNEGLNGGLNEGLKSQAGSQLLELPEGALVV
jgi:hypothetical protein